jgi:ribose transport system ATP-binding protein
MITTTAPLLDARGVTKTFPGVRALDEVDFDVRSHEVHALLGENGAGKSTLMNVLAGALRPDAGTISIGDERFDRIDAARAHEIGIGFIRQEPNVLDDLTVMENMTLGSEQRRLGLLEDRGDEARARACLERVDLRVRPTTLAIDLPLAQRQLLAIAKTLFQQPQLLIMDEPTATLSFGEAERLFQIIAEEVDAGRSIVYISHRLEEIFRIADRATVLRNGRRIGTVDIRGGETTQDDLIRMMIGRDLGEAFPERTPVTPARDGHRLVLRGLMTDVRPSEPDLTLHGGEVLGIAGLVGSGRTELVEALFGAAHETELEAELDGRPVARSGPAAAADAGIALVPEDRRHQGFVGAMSIEDNITLAIPRRISSFGVIRRSGARTVTRDLMDRLAVRAYGPEQAVETLSGGNQQKVVIAKWMAHDSTVFIFDEPTKGVDVGARGEIYREIAALSAAGKVVIVVSSEMPEVLGLSDQILVMHQGAPSALLSRAEADAETVLRAAFGQKEAS